jgi:hypothetical protein
MLASATKSLRLQATKIVLNPHKQPLTACVNLAQSLTTIALRRF